MIRMNKTKILTICLGLTFTVLVQAGIGDIIGGSSAERQRFSRIMKNASTYIEGDTIHFQEHSMWVRASINKSLCFDGNYYQAIVALCVDFDHERGCTQTQRTRVYQPEISTKHRCIRPTERGCDEYEEVLFRQNPVRNITLKDQRSSGSVLARAKVRIRSCR